MRRNKTFQPVPKALLIITLLGWLAIYDSRSAAAEQSSKIYKFADYPATSKFSGKVRLPDFKNNQTAKTFRTRIRNGMKHGPNFAGHYSLIEIGCGSSCLFGVLVDSNTGRLLDFPLGGEENYQLVLSYTKESRLLKAVWKDTSSGGYENCVQQYYLVGSGALKLADETRYTVEQFALCSVPE